MVSLDRFAYGLPDPQEEDFDEEDVVFYCDGCGEAIYEGQEYVDSNVGSFCCLDCLLDDLDIKHLYAEK